MPPASRRRSAAGLTASNFANALAAVAKGLAQQFPTPEAATKSIRDFLDFHSNIDFHGNIAELFYLRRDGGILPEIIVLNLLYSPSKRGAKS